MLLGKHSVCTRSTQSKPSLLIFRFLLIILLFYVVRLTQSCSQLVRYVILVPLVEGPTQRFSEQNLLLYLMSGDCTHEFDSTGWMIKFWVR